MPGKTPDGPISHTRKTKKFASGFTAGFEQLEEGGRGCAGTMKGAKRQPYLGRLLDAAGRAGVERFAIDNAKDGIVQAVGDANWQLLIRG